MTRIMLWLLSISVVASGSGITGARPSPSFLGPRSSHRADGDPGRGSGSPALPFGGAHRWQRCRGSSDVARFYRGLPSPAPQPLLVHRHERLSLPDRPSGSTSAP